MLWAGHEFTARWRCDLDLQGRDPNLRATRRLKLVVISVKLFQNPTSNNGHIGTPNPNEYMGCVCGRNPKRYYQCKADADKHEEAGDEVNNEDEGDEEDGDARHHEVPDDLSVHVLQKDDLGVN